jgi:hypothetical protein
LNPAPELLACFGLGLLHGVLPDEHTWPITFSYAIGGASGKEGMKAGLYFSAAFAVQRALLSMVAYLALAKYLQNEIITSVVFILVGLAMAVAGAIVLRRNETPHLHLFGHHHDHPDKMELSHNILSRRHEKASEPVKTPPPRWAMIHGFIAGFGFEGLAVYTSVVGAHMPNIWMSLLPGLLFGLGTMLVLMVLGAIFGALLHWVKGLTEQQVRRIGVKTSGRALFYGGILFILFGFAMFAGVERFIRQQLGIEEVGYLIISIFMLAIVIPAFIYSWRQVKREDAQPNGGE